MDRCPNYQVCGGRENKYHGVCYKCDNHLHGYSRKKDDLIYCVRPSVDRNPGRNHLHYLDRIISSVEQSNLLRLLEERKMETGILEISEKVEECPVCSLEKDIFVKHPTCGEHELCKDCFKITFLNDHIVYSEPERPQGYYAFRDWEHANGLAFGLSKPEDFEHPRARDRYSYWVDEPKPEWPEYIKQIYPNMAKFLQGCESAEQLYERRIDQAEEMRRCPVCREINLKI